MLLRIGAAAEKIGVHRDTLRDWPAGQGPRFTRTPGGHRRYDEAEIERWLADSDARVPARTS